MTNAEEEYKKAMEYDDGEVQQAALARAKKAYEEALASV
jgi:hypothetical protein